MSIRAAVCGLLHRLCARQSISRVRTSDGARSPRPRVLLRRRCLWMPAGIAFRIRYGPQGKPNALRVMPDTQPPSPRRRERLTGVRLFIGDSVTAFRLLNEARHRIMSAACGISRGDSNLMTLFVLGALIRALKRAAATPGNQVRKARSSPTAAGDTMIGAAVASETVNRIAGHPGRDTPFAAALIVLALTIHAFRTPIRRLLHVVRRSFHDLAIAAHKARAVMRRWGISPSNIPGLPSANSPAAGEDRAH